MSSSSSLADYRAALTAPGAVLPVVASAVARLPMAMIGLATLLYVQRVTGSFGVAGLVSAGMLIGVSCGSVVQGPDHRPHRADPSRCSSRAAPSRSQALRWWWPSSPVRPC
jgi:hypothetical protein